MVMVRDRVRGRVMVMVRGALPRRRPLVRGRVMVMVRDRVRGRVMVMVRGALPRRRPLVRGRVGVRG